jgi:hypothetical protein
VKLEFRESWACGSHLWYTQLSLTSFSGRLPKFPFCPAEFQNEKDELLPERGERFMNILLQNRKTLNFLGAASGWTSDHYKARIFSTGLEAMVFCLNHHIGNMQIVGEFVDRRMDFTVPITDVRGD